MVFVFFYFWRIIIYSFISFLFENWALWPNYKKKNSVLVIMVIIKDYINTTYPLRTHICFIVVYHFPFSRESSFGYFRPYNVSNLSFHWKGSYTEKGPQGDPASCVLRMSNHPLASVIIYDRQFTCLHVCSLSFPSVTFVIPVGIRNHIPLFRPHRYLSFFGLLLMYKI